MMKHRCLGNTNLQVSEIGLGCWQLGSLVSIIGIPLTYGDFSEKEALKIIDSALDLGINTFDTADLYSLGQSERRLGMAIKEKRSDVYIFTKAGKIPSFTEKHITDTDLSYHHLLSAIDRSLKRLDTDYVDLFQIHSTPQSEEDFKNIEKVFERVKSENKAMYCGVSIGNQYEKGIELIERGIVDSLQISFSLLDYNASIQLFPLAKKSNIGIIVSMPLAQGFLAGKYNSNVIFPKNDVRSMYSKKDIENKAKKAQDFQVLLNEEMTMNQLALAYILSHEEVSTCIPGAKSVAQLESNVSSSKISLTLDELEKIKKIQNKW
jgi:aryl-alcohol dehydrogenase-like predicted oxidoreductase